MDAYVYDADIYCEDCAPEGADGPYPDGGGEADTPVHCGGCHCYLDAPLTGDGVEYAIDALESYLWDRRGDVEVLKQWADALKSYRLDTDDLKTLYAFEIVCHREG